MKARGGDEDVTPMTDLPTILRIVTFNDVYELDHLPHVATALRAVKSEAGPNITVICTLPGDFLAPSLLSSLDHGRGMIDVLNAVGVDLVCIGNHETDVPHAALLERIRESKFLWLNTNMPGLPLGEAQRTKVVETYVMDVGDKRVGFLGLLTEDRSMYRPDSFAGAEILPVATMARSYREKLLSEGCDLVIPLTHQGISPDRELAQKGLFPLILAGHDHDPYLETTHGSTLIKVGCDAHFIGIVDVEWPPGCRPGTLPTVNARIESIKGHDPDPDIQSRVQMHQRILLELEKAMLCRCPSDVTLSSCGTRRGQTTVGTMLVTAVRKALHVHAAMVNGGNIRGNTAYPPEKVSFTYADLKTELPFACEIVVVRLPDHVLAATIEYSRQWAHLEPPVEKGGFLQVDDQVLIDDVTHKVTHVGGKPLDPDKMYNVATTYGAVSGIDNVKPLLEYRAANPEGFPSSPECGRGMKELLVEYFARSIWWEMASAVGFAGMDTDRDGTIDRAELKAALRGHYSEEMGQLVVDNLMAAADADRDGRISKTELLDVCLATEAMRDYADKDADGRLTFEELWEVIQKHWEEDGVPAGLGKEEAREIFDSVDSNKDGAISYAEFFSHLKKWRAGSALKI